MEKNYDLIWQEYAHTKDGVLREKLILEYVHIVKYVAGRISIHIGNYMDFEDILSYGIFGLIDAIDKFDYTKGVKFETYASLRIRGAIIDNIRKLDWVPRTLRVKNKQLEQVYAELESVLSRQPTEAELAEKLGVDENEAIDMIKKSSIASLVSFDEYIEQNHEAPIFADNNNDPERAMEVSEVKRMLADIISKLTEKQQQVVNLYYFEEMTLKEISAVMGVSESRVSQIHAAAVLKMRAKLGRYRSLLFI
jgi:RNA polymerase sigma factor for flagellar operon FliA